MTNEEIFLTVVNLFAFIYVIGIYQYYREKKRKKDEEQE